MCVGMLFRSMCYWLPREAWLNLLMHGVRTVTNISFITSHRAKRLPGSSNGLTDTTMMAFTFAHWVHSISIFVVDMKQNYDVNIRWMTFALIRLQDFRFSRQMHGWWSFGSLRRVGWYFGCMPTFRRDILPPSSRPGDGSSMFLRNVGIQPKYYTAQEDCKRNKFFIFQPSWIKALHTYTAIYIIRKC
jgi:hypothetical protein